MDIGNREPIVEITETGIRTTKQHYEFDIIVLHGEVDPDGDSATPKSKAGKKNRGPVIPHKYKDGKTSGLSATIKSGENNITLDLKSK